MEPKELSDNLDYDKLMEDQKQEFKKLLDNNVWDYRPEEFVVSHAIGGDLNAPTYEVALDKMPDSAAVLDNIAQVCEKTWATPVVVGDLVILLNAVLGLQGNYCGGASRRGGPIADLPPLP